MTIFQARYGSNAEIGRIPTRKPREEQTTRGLAAGVGLAGAGGATYYAGKAIPARINQRIVENVKNSRHWRDEKTVYENQLKALKGQVTRQSKHNREVAMQRKMLEAEKGLANAERMRRAEAKRFVANRAKQARIAPKAAFARKAGLVGLAAGLGLSGASLYRTEKARGTFGYKRPTMRGMSNESF